MSNTLIVQSKYFLRLYVSGLSASSTKSIENIKSICETYINTMYEMEVVDIYQQPELVIADNIIAIPTLIKMNPLPCRKIVGDLSDMRVVLQGLDIET